MTNPIRQWSCGCKEFTEIQTVEPNWSLCRLHRIKLENLCSSLQIYRAIEERKKGSPPLTIGTVAGTAFFVRTEVEDVNGKWNDSYTTKDGFWVIHDGNFHHVYQTRRGE